MSKTVEDVKSFWEENPLFSSESEHQAGTKAFFEEHSSTYYKDVFAGKFNDNDFIPEDLEGSTILDLGCGVGFWTVEIQKKRKCKQFYSADLTSKALNLTKKRLEIHGLTAELSVQNAEKMSFESDFFDHLNCQGVIHHTPDTNAAIKEIARVLKKGGTASISVYYKNIFLRNWNKISLFGRIISRLGGGLKGRGREGIFKKNNTDEIIRLYDGEANPVGKAYSKSEIIKMVSPYFSVENTFLFFFPARALPFKIPRFLHQFLSREFGFMIHLNLRKE